MRETIGGYHIWNKIGEGAFGTVYRAYDPSSSRAVALKTLKSDNAHFVARFRRESALLSEIDHANVARLHGYGEDGDVRYIVMELMTYSLREALQSAGRLPLSRAADICRQAALGLKAIHERNIVHRDVKPDNILFDSGGNVKVSDLGIARAETLPSLTTTGIGMGTRGYMSPEQYVDSKRVDARSDIYSLGVTLHEMLTGNPYGLDQHVRASVPSDLERIINRCLEMDPKQRYHTMGELIREISNPTLVNRCALIDFYEATGGPNWKRNDNWLTDAPLSEWYGVDVNARGQVDALALVNNNLSGAMPSEVGYLSELRVLSIWGTSIWEETALRGKLPDEFFGLSKLELLWLQGNQLTGDFPRKLGDLENLYQLRLAGNNWTGCIPRPLFNILHRTDQGEIDLPICDD